MDRKRYLASITAEDRKLVGLFKEEMDRITLLYFKAIRSNDITKANDLLKRMKVIKATLNNEYGERADVRLPTEYIKGVSYINNVVGLGAGVISGVVLDKAEIKAILKELGPIHIEAVNAILNTSKNYVKSSLDGMERQAITMIGELHQEKIREQLAKGMIAGEGLGGMKKRAVEYFTENGINGFKDRGGKMRTMDSYVDMLTRTETSIANVQGTINRALQLGITKFRIIEHDDCCHICEEVRDDVVDIRDGVVELPPFHPNCRGYIVAEM